MNDNRHQAIIASLFIIMVFFVGVFLNFSVGLSKKPFWFGVLMGLALTLISSTYIMLVWDPKKLSPRNPETKVVDARLMSVVVIGGLIAGRLLLLATGGWEELESLLIGLFSSWIILTFGFLSFQVWYHRPK